MRVASSSISGAFQRGLLRQLALSKTVLKESFGVVKADHFTTPEAREVAGLIFAFYHKYKDAPRRALYDLAKKTGLSDPAILLCKRLLSKSKVSSQYVKDELAEFIQKASLSQLMADVEAAYESGDLTQAENLLRDFRGRHSAFPSKGEALIGNSKARVLTRSQVPEDRLATFIVPLDAALSGGIRRGEEALLAAVPHTGKTAGLCHLCRAAIAQGKTCAFYTLESSEDAICQRIEMGFSGLTQEELRQQPSKVCKQLKMAEQFGGECFVKHWPSGKATILDIEKHLDFLESEGHIVDTIFVDYGEIVRSRKAYDDRRHEVSSVYEDFKGLVSEKHIFGWIAGQGNREGMTADALGFEHMAETFLGKAAVPDVVVMLSVNGRVNDELKATGFLPSEERYMTCRVAKNREGVSGQIFDIRQKLKVMRFFIPENSYQHFTTKNAQRMAQQGAVHGGSTTSSGQRRQRRAATP